MKWMSIPLLAVFALACFADDSLLQKKQLLTLTIDSLEIEQQMLKRKGESFQNLQSRCDSLKDSVAAIKTILGEGSIAGKPKVVSAIPLKSAPHNSPVWKNYLPKSTLDWAILVVAILATVAGVALLIGLFITMKSRKKRSAAKAKSVTGTHEFYPNLQYANRESAPSASSIAPAQSADLSMLSALRQKVAEATHHYTDLDKRPRITSPDSVSSSQSANSSDLHIRIRELSASGMESAEIARQLHVSFDQIQLILRLSKR